MQTFTGAEYLMIDAANHFGLDKEVYEVRIQWAKDNLDNLEAMALDADDLHRYNKAVIAIRKAQRKEPSGHLVGFDAICSGMQIMSAITGCFDGASATGLIHQDQRSNAYKIVTDTMNTLLLNEVKVSLQEAKEATMTTLYGSKAMPKKIFGEDTPELAAFYTALKMVAPGSMGLLHELLESWQPFALAHKWVLPDGFTANVKVMDDCDARIEVDELDHATFTYEWKENCGKPKGLSNVANVVHSIDGYIVRSLHRRCNYKESTVLKALGLLVGDVCEETKESEKISYYIDLYKNSNMADVVILPYLTKSNVGLLSKKHKAALVVLCNQMLEYSPFPIVTNHDEFQCHANNMNYLRQQYNNVLADLADSLIIQDILSQIHGCKGTFTKLSNDLSGYIRNANYSLT